MTDVVLIALFTLALAIGYFLGRRSHKSRKGSASPELSAGKHYFQGLNFLLSEQPDKAVEEFVRLLDVNTYTFDTHIALGKLMRKQGEVERAIRIHQNLLSRPQLSQKEQHQVHLELARDFLAAGLYDRAETLLETVIEESAELRSIAQRYLIDIYQNESEWLQAVEVANALLQSKYMKSNAEARKELTVMIAHFYCQLAEETDAGSDKQQQKKYVDLAIAADKTVVRTAVLSAALEVANQRYKQAIKIVGRLEAQNANEFVLCLPVLQQAYQQQFESDGFDRFVEHVVAYLGKQRSTPVLNYLIRQLLEAEDNQPERLEQARALLSAHVEQYASLTAANKLVELQLQAVERECAEREAVERKGAEQNVRLVDVVEGLTRQVAALLSKRHFFRCTRCGFSGRQIHWRCPSCKRWETMKSIEELRLS